MGSERGEEKRGKEELGSHFRDMPVGEVLM